MVKHVWFALALKDNSVGRNGRYNFAFGEAIWVVRIEDKANNNYYEI